MLILTPCREQPTETASCSSSRGSDGRRAAISLAIFDDDFCKRVCVATYFQNLMVSMVFTSSFFNTCPVQAITRLLLDIVGVAENNGLKLPREFGMLIKQVRLY